MRDQLKSFAPEGSFVEYEVTFRALPEHELRVADVACVSCQRWEQADPEDNFRGAPDLIIEVLSPSNLTYRSGGTIPLTLFGESRLNVDSIFTTR